MLQVNHLIGFGVASGSMGGDALIAGETDGLGIDFTYADRAIQMAVRDVSTPANTGNFDPFNKLTYTSPSVKLCRQSDGIYRYSNHNLCLESQTLGTTWGTSGTGTLVLTEDATTAPDGTMTADDVAYTSGTGWVYRQQIAGLVANVPYTFSIFAKKNATDWMRLSISNTATTNSGRAWFDLNTGTLGSNGTSGSGYTYVTSSITAAGNGWYNCSVTVIPDGTTIWVWYKAADGDGSTTAPATSATYLWGGQLKRYPVQDAGGYTFATGYIATTTTAKYDLPYEWDASGNSKGLLIEEARSNLLLRSQAFDNASWTKSNLTATADQDTAPDGITSADTLTATSNDGYVSQNFGGGSNTAQYGSVYLKRKTGSGAVTVEQGKNVTTPTLTGSYQRVEVSGASTAATYAVVSNVNTVTMTAHNMQTGDSVRFDASSGGAGDTTVSSITVTGVDTFTFAQVTGDTSGNCNIYPRTFRIKLATSGDEVYAWGAQNEAGSFATSPIHTAAATVTRALDQLDLPISSFGYADSGGTWIVEAQVWYTPTLGGSRQMLDAHDTTANERNFIQLATGDDSLFYQVVDGGSNTVATSVTGTITANTTFKCAAAFATNDSAFVVNGGSVLTDGTCTMPTPTTLSIGVARGATAAANAYIRQLTHLKRRMANADMQTRTS